CTTGSRCLAWYRSSRRVPAPAGTRHRAGRWRRAARRNRRRTGRTGTPPRPWPPFPLALSVRWRKRSGDVGGTRGPGAVRQSQAGVAGQAAALVVTADRRAELIVVGRETDVFHRGLLCDLLR